MPTTATTFLMFDGTAEQAMRFYVSLFPGSRVTHLELYGPGGAGPEGSIKKATFTLCGQNMACSDSPIKHSFGFTPAISIFIDCSDDAELDNAFEQLSEGGEILMPLDDYGFSRKFGWVNDRFGVSWQLNLAA
jgi:predicted 3-demethylubiquinone-9 3-methyltransferase (glyoxalase superfamily)